VLLPVSLAALRGRVADQIHIYCGDSLNQMAFGQP
jgi:hypothetical protein